MWAGATALGKFLIPTTPVEAGVTPEVIDEEPVEETEEASLQYRWLLTMPEQFEWDCKTVDQFGEPILEENGQQKTERRTSYVWTEVVERKSIDDDDDVRVMVWNPVSDNEVAEAQRFYAAAKEIDWDSPEIHTIGFGPERPKRVKHPPRTLDRNIPASDFVELEDVEWSGVAAWGKVAGRMDEILPNTLSLEPEQVVIEMYVLVENRGSRDLGVDAASLRLNTSKSETLAAYPGCQVDDCFFPYVIEVMGEDISEEHRSKIALSPSESCVIEFSFPMPNRMKEAVAVKLCQSIEVPIAAGECDVVVLDRQ